MEQHKFFKENFDESTNTKLELFKLYIRSWIPVFLSRPSGGKTLCKTVNIYDFFAGPGMDNNGNQGSPLIILQELKNFCELRDKNSEVNVNIIFNDIKAKHIKLLKTAVSKVACDKPCCQIKYTNTTFEQALNDTLPEMKDEDAANLVIIDQFGVKEITKEIFQKLVTCKKTDILFFITSSTVRRFTEQPEIKNIFNIGTEIKNIEYNGIHRYICQYYKNLVPSDEEYHLLPFSIKKKKSGNIYGVIFGSHNLTGSKKFLEACWKLDEVTGEANYDIDNDGEIRRGQLSLFAEDNKIKKMELFHQELEEELNKKIDFKGSLIPIQASNHSIYRFTLKKSFLPKHARSHLKKLQKDGRLEVSQQKIKGAFYLNNRNIDVHFTLKE